MSCLKARNGNTSRVKPLQRAHFKNLCEMKRFADEQKILGKDHRRSMFLINREIQEVQKTLTDIKLISGYCHQAYTAHLRSVSIAFATFKEYEKNLGNIDLNVKSADSVKSDVMFGQRHDSMKDCLFEEDTGGRESDSSEVYETVDTNARKKLSSNSIHLTRTKNCTSSFKHFKNGLGDCFDVSSSCFDVLESSSSEKDVDAHTQKTSRASHTKAHLKNNSSSPTRFTLHRRRTPVHQKTDLRKCPTPVTRKPSREWKNSKTLSRHIHYHDTKSDARSVSKAAIKRGLDLLIKEYNDPQNLQLLNKRRRSVLKDKVSDFVSELSESKCEATNA